MLKNHFFILLLKLLLLISAKTFALESLGVFKFHDFSLSPRVEVNEPSQGGFDLKETWIAVEWSKDEQVHGEFRMGTLDLYSPTIWYQSPSAGLGLVEAWLESKTKYGNLKVGRLPIPDGFESTFVDGFWLMPPSQVKKRNWLFSRDEGLTYEAETKPWLTSMTVHNGEAGRNLDGKMWATGRFQYFNNSTGYGALLTGSVGGTSPASTSSSGANHPAANQEKFIFDPTDSSKIRYGTISFFHLLKRNYFNLEAGRGDILQKDDKFPFAWGRFDVSWNLQSDFNYLLRYEQTQSDLKNNLTIRKHTGLGLLYSSADQLSSVMFFLTRIEEEPKVHNDEASLVFRINSSSLGI